MMKKNRGFTLIELVATIAISMLAFMVIAYITQSVYVLVTNTSDLSQAQITANTAMTLVQNKIRSANYLNIEQALPTTPNTAYRYLYNDAGGVIETQNVTQKSVIYSQQGEYSHTVSFSKVNDKAIRITITVLKSGKVVYKLNSEFIPNNLISNNITGLQQGSCVSYQVTVQSFTPVTAISIVSESNFITVDAKTMQCSTHITPTDATVSSVAWSVSDRNIASIDQNGLLTPLKNGAIYVIATALDGSGVTSTKQIVISNQKIVIESLDLNTSTGVNTLKVGGYSLTIIPTITPSDATNKQITWSVSDSKLASINSSGVLTSNSKSGKSVIVTAKTNDGSNIEATIEIQIVS